MYQYMYTIVVCNIAQALPKNELIKCQIEISL